MKYYKVWDRFIMLILTSISFRLSSQYIYWRAFKKRLNLKSPSTFNEKLMWLKLFRYAKDPVVTRCVDKYEVRHYLEEQGFSELLIPLLGVWDRPEDIPVEMLPEQFVLKCNHGCGYNLLCIDKNDFEIENAKKQITKWLHEDFWRRFGECNYKNIPKKVLCEAYIGSTDNQIPVDYKFYCFHGTAKYVMVCCNRICGTPQFYFFNRQWQMERINPDGKRAPAGFSLPKPEKIDDMFSYADRLSAPFPFVRVDLYVVESHIYFGELTFIPSAALDTARLPEADQLFSSLLTLP